MSPRTAPRLIGRERELAAVADALTRSARDASALVTIVGPVGVGKSALATRVAADQLAGGAFGVALHVDASAASPALSLRQALDAASASRAHVDTVLVVVDGCDDVGDPEAVLAALLAEEPSATILATSRSPLRTPGELVVELAPLATPPDDEPESPAFDCLVAQLPEGARAGLLSGDRAALAALLRELDGLPLAIALAAPRLALMDARSLLHRLHRSRSILERPSAQHEERRPFEAALGSAIQALSEPSRAALAAIASFAGPSTLDALEAVVGRASPEAPRALDVIAELRERSLLLAVPGEGELRLGMLRCVREIVVRSASPADLDAGRDRHAAYFTDLAEALHRGATTGGVATGRAAADRGEFLAVLERAVGAATLTGPMVDRALRLLVAIHAVPGAMPPAAFLPIIDAAVDRTKDSGADPALVAKALVVRARARRATHDAKGGARDLLRALQVAAPARRRDVEAEALIELAHLLADRGELEAAVDHARRASLAWRDVGDRIREAVAAALVGDLERRRGDMTAAREAIDRATPLAAAGGTTPFEVVAAALRLHLETRDDRELHHAITSARARPYRPGQTATLLLFEAVLLHHRGELVAAREAYAATDDAARAAGAAPLSAETALFDGLAALALGRRGEALARLRVADLDGPGAIASDVGAIARAVSFALDAWLTPVWRGPRPAVGRSRLCRGLVDGAEAGLGFDALRAALAEDGDDRVLFHLLARALGGRAPERATLDPEVAQFDVDGKWFRLPAEPLVGIERRKPLAAMLKLLVAERLARPGTSVSSQRLLAAGWPGERVQAEAGAHRVRVALSTLRKLGLRAVLLTTGDGYALDPARKLTTATEDDP